MILLTEVWAYHVRHAERHDRYRPAIAEFVEIAANFTDAVPYLAAQRAPRRWAPASGSGGSQDNGVDVVLEPTLPIVPYERGPGYDRGNAGGPGDPMIALTALWDMTGMPVAALPVSWDVGVSLIAPRGAETRGHAGGDRPPGARARRSGAGRLIEPASGTVPAPTLAR